MDPLIRQVSRWSRKGLAPLSLIAGIAIGIYLYQVYGLQLSGGQLHREISPRGPLTSDEVSTVELFEQAEPSVVFITTKQRGWYIQRWNVMEIPKGSGSGFIWDAQGHVVTNHHVIEGANLFEVVLYDHSTYDAKLVGSFPDKDLAVLRIDAPAKVLRPIPLGTTTDLKVGQKVLAIGNPFGLDHTLTSGIVSALGRTLESVNKRKIQGAIQTDAAINPGNSGGPLLDSAGRLIGVNTQIYSTSGSSAGIGFAIPVDTVNDVVPLLIRDGKISRPGLGIVPYDQNEWALRRLGIRGGVIIDKVPSGGAADRAGLRGLREYRDGSYLIDVIVKVDDTEIANLEDLNEALESRKIGDTVTVVFLRGRELIDTKVTLQAIN